MVRHAVGSDAVRGSAGPKGIDVHVHVQVQVGGVASSLRSGLAAGATEQLAGGDLLTGVSK